MTESRKKAVAAKKSPATTKKAPSRKAAPKPAPAARSHAPERKSAPTDEQIAEHAYYIWEAKGCPTGQELECWLEAEQRLGVRPR